MGAIQSACPVRKTPATQAASPKKVEKVVCAPKVRTTKHLEGGSLSKSAECFHPSLLSPSPDKVPETCFTAKEPVRRQVAPAALESKQKGPDWAQYLEKKVMEKCGDPRAEPKSNLLDFTDQQKNGAAPAANFVLQTSDYLKLLKDGEQNHGFAQGKPLSHANSKLFSKGTSVAELKSNSRNQKLLAAALDSIIQTQQSNQHVGPKKADSIKTQKDYASAKGVDLLSRIAQMIDSKDGAEEEPKVDAVCVQDDIFCDQANRDEDLAGPFYWSDDDQAPRAVKRASAHSALGKVPGVRPRHYVTQKLDDGLDHHVAIMLNNLMKLSDRQRSIDSGLSGKHRFIVGLKEVHRGVRQGRVKCVVVAPDIEEMAPSGASVDERVQEIVCACYKQDTPVIFALNRCRMGRALGKSLRISALAIVDVTGVKNLYAEILEQSYSQRIAWLAEQPRMLEASKPPWRAKAAEKEATKHGAKAK